MKFFTDYYQKRGIEIQYVEKNEKEISFTFIHHPLLNGMRLEKKYMQLSIFIEETNETFQQFYQQKLIESLSKEEKEILYALIDWFQEQDPQPKMVFPEETIGRSLVTKRNDFKESKTGKWTKTVVPDFYSFQQLFKGSVREWLETYEQKHIDLVYVNTSLHKRIRYYYCGIKSTIEFHWKRQQIMVMDCYHGEEFLIEKVEEVQEVLNQIFTKIEQSMRIKNTLRPQRYHFDRYTKKFFRQKDRENVYHALLKVMTPQDIEKLSAEKKKQKIEVELMEDVENDQIICYILDCYLTKSKHDTTWNIQ